MGLGHLGTWRQRPSRGAGLAVLARPWSGKLGLRGGVKESPSWVWAPLPLGPCLEVVTCVFCWASVLCVSGLQFTFTPRSCARQGACVHGAQWAPSLASPRPC